MRKMRKRGGERKSEGKKHRDVRMCEQAGTGPLLSCEVAGGLGSVQTGLSALASSARWDLIADYITLLRRNQ